MTKKECILYCTIVALAGILIGFILSPVKKGVGGFGNYSGSSFTFRNSDDVKELLNPEDEDKE